MTHKVPSLPIYTCRTKEHDWMERGFVSKALDSIVQLMLSFRKDLQAFGDEDVQAFADEQPNRVPNIRPEEYKTKTTLHLTALLSLETIINQIIGRNLFMFYKQSKIKRRV